MNKNDVTAEELRKLRLNKYEAAIYLELLKQPLTHAQLSTATGINRTTLYRLVDSLEKRGLILRRLDDRGKFLAAADPSTLEAEVVSHEAQTKLQRDALNLLLPRLEEMRKGYAADFAVHTYEGIEGFKRMLWHELKTREDCLCIGHLSLQDIVGNQNWAEKHRQMTVDAGYRVREIVNPGSIEEGFTDVPSFRSIYDQRIIGRDILPINHLMTTYNETVATYHVYEGRRIGLEVISRPYAETVRSLLEILWGMSAPWVPDDTHQTAKAPYTI